MRDKEEAAVVSGGQDTSTCERAHRHCSPPPALSSTAALAREADVLLVLALRLVAELPDRSPWSQAALDALTDAWSNVQRVRDAAEVTP